MRPKERARIRSDEYALLYNYAIRLRPAQRQITVGSEAWIAAAAGSYCRMNATLRISAVTDALNAGAVS
jgi:hypothetical protein